MKLFFCFLTILIVSCRHKNQIALEHFPQSEQKLFLSLEHPREQSLLRKKLLNLKLRGLLKDTSRFEQKEIIENGDEFVLENVSRKLSLDQISQYKKLRSHCAEIIVSYQERQEIYFVMPGVDVNVIIKSLNLINENNNQFTIFRNGDQTVEGEVIYVLNAGKDEMLSNDRIFHWSVGEIEDNIDGEKFVIHSHQKLNLKIQAKHLVDQLMTSTITAAKSKCTPQKMEAQACDPCQYQMEIISGTQIELPIKSFPELHLDILLNGKSFLEKEVSVTKLSSGDWGLEIDPHKIKGAEELIVVEFRHTYQLNGIRKVHGRNYTPSCLDTQVVRDISFKEEFPVRVDYSIFGRELLIDSIKEGSQ